MVFMFPQLLQDSARRVPYMMICCHKMPGQYHKLLYTVTKSYFNSKRNVSHSNNQMDYSHNNVLRLAALLVGRSRDRSPVVSLGIFLWFLPTKPCALRSTQPLKINTRDFSWGKGGRCVWLTTYHPSSAESREDLGP